MGKKHQIFTPSETINLILDKIGFDGKHILGKYIVDHSCGTGNFLEEIVKRIIRYSSKEDIQKNLSFVYGFEIDEELIPILKNRLNNLIKEYNISIEWNIFNMDSLKIEKSFYDFFDYVVGNPPYIKSSDLEEYNRQFLKNNYSFCEKGNIDIYYAFFELSFRLIKSDGKISMITPNSFLYNVSANTLRKYISDNNFLEEIINYGTKKIFNNADTYTAITYFNMSKTDSNFSYTLYENDKSTKFNVDLNNLKDSKMWIFKNSKGERLGDYVNISVGIATLCDKAFLMEKIKEIDDDIWLVNNKIVGEIEIEKDILVPIMKISKMKTSYILFPYFLDNNKYKIINEETLINKYPKAYKHLCNVKPHLDKRDKGKENKVAWYAYGRGQGINIVDKKILFSGMSDKPNFIYNEDKTLLYSGYYITLKEKCPYTYNELIGLLNSEKMREFVAYSSGDFSGGYKSYKKSIIENFKL